MRDGGAAKERILEAARGEFLEHGYAGVSVREIIDLLGVSKGGFYHHYTSKEELLGDIVTDELLRWQEAAREIVADESASTAERLRRLFLLPASRNGRIFGLLFEAFRELETAEKTVAHAVEALIGQCRALLIGGQKRGEVRDFLDCESWSFQIVATIEGALLVSTLGRLSGLEGRLEESFENTWRSIRALAI